MKLVRLVSLLSIFLLASCQTLSTYSPSFFANDAQIVNAVKASFNQNELLIDAPIQVESNHGAVILSGYVKKIRQADVAEELASKTAGVKTVENRIIIRK